VCSFWLDGAGRLDLVVLDVAVVAGEGHDDHLAEIGDRGEEQTGSALNTMLDGVLKRHFGAGCRPGSLTFSPQFMQSDSISSTGR
jgi:hypothetical protein